MNVSIAYGKRNLDLCLPAEQTTVFEPQKTQGLSDERQSLRAALQSPIGASPLSSQVSAATDICIVFTDSTRATPNHRLIPWLLEYLEEAGAEPSRITLLNGTGTHRPNTPLELAEMLTPAVLEKYRVVNHHCDEEHVLLPAGQIRGKTAWLNRHLVSADLRIITGFIEPHFFAGFSGGPKGVMPGVAGLATIMENHSPRNIADPLATFAITEGNPIWEEMRDVALLVAPLFLLNVALNEEREITGLFAGDLLEAHRAGVDFVKRTAMCPTSAPFDLVITSNSGFPLDQNLYQGVKGMAAAARIVKPGGIILLACECSQGAPGGSHFEKTLLSASSVERLAHTLSGRTHTVPEDWQVQILINVRQKAEVMLYSTLPADQVARFHLSPVEDLHREVHRLLKSLGESSRVAVLPQGPLAIPYLES